MASTISDLFGSVTTFTITLASLASSTAGVGRQSTLVDNTTDLYSSAIIYCNIMVGTTPTINSLIYIYLIRSNNAGTQIADDNAGASDAALTVINSTLLDTILCPATTSNVAYRKSIDTSAVGPLGPEWGIAIVNSTGVNLNSTGGNHVVSWIGVNKNAT